jgi:hypothetical protein
LAIDNDSNHIAQGLLTAKIVFHVLKCINKISRNTAYPMNLQKEINPDENYTFDGKN